MGKKLYPVKTKCHYAKFQIFSGKAFQVKSCQKKILKSCIFMLCFNWEIFWSHQLNGTFYLNITLSSFKNFPQVIQPYDISKTRIPSTMKSKLKKFPRLEHTSHTMTLSELPPKLRNPTPRLSR